MNKLSSLPDITETTYFIYKHSITCGICKNTYKSVTNAESKIDLPIYLLLVQENRPLSEEIERYFGIRHHTPQIILVRDGKALWHADNFNILENAIVSAAKNAVGSQG